MAFNDAINAALSSVRAVAGRTVTYHRGALAVVVGGAVVGKTTHNAADAYGTVTEVVSRDYLIPAAALVLAGKPITPKVGDTIEDGETTYTVLAPTGGPCWRPVGPGGTTWRIHTKR